MRKCLVVVRNQEEADNFNKLISFANGEVDDSLKIRHSNGHLWDILTPVGQYYIVTESYLKQMDDRFRGMRVDELVYMGEDWQFYNDVLKVLKRQ